MGFNKFSGSFVLLRKTLCGFFLFFSFKDISFLISSNFFCVIVLVFPNHFLSGAILAGVSGLLKRSFDGFELYKFKSFIFAGVL
jgi:hypothetical protein